MRKKSGLTIVEQAIVLVPEFEKVVHKLEQQVTLRGQSKSTLQNYTRRIALFVVHFGKLPEQIDPEEINEYLVALARDPRSPSRSSFKHMVYGLRYYYRLLGMNKNAIALPSLKKDTKLPVILNQQELKELFAAPSLLKQRVVLTLIYSAGLRGQEVINLKISDIDFERKTIHIRQSKYKKDRVVPLAESMAVGLKKYLSAEHPHIWLFNGKELDGRYSVRGLSWVMRENLKKTSITKEVNLHSLRHSYATHLLEQGLNIVTLKELLGHSQITTTMIYLHVAQCELLKVHSPLDTLYITIPTMRTKFELADVVSLFGASLLARAKLTPLQLKVLGKIASCRTSALGGHEEHCNSCGAVRYSYNSCRDRHCPKCQAAKQAFWIEDLIQNTLPIKHYHIVFTLPHQLNSVCLHNQKMYYDLLFAAVWNTLRSFGYSHYGVEGGAVAVLHTWGQNLSLHPHLHCIVPAAGYTLNGQWKNIGHSGKYLYPVHQLSDAFKGKFLDSLKRTLRKQNELLMFEDKIQQAYDTRWVVHCEPSLASAEHVVKYLGQYTHRVAITNQRILNIADGKVTFIAKDYRQGAVKKPITMNGVEFLRRFTMHILPKRFVKIRRYGIYNHTTKRKLGLHFVPEEKPNIDTLIKQKQPPETNQERFKRLTGVDSCQCHVCKTGRMVTVRELPKIRSPVWFQYKQPQTQY